MDIYRYLQADHRMLQALMAQVQDAQDAQERARHFFALRFALLLHAETEEAIFYAALHHAGADTEAAEEEHAQLARLLARLAQLPVESPAWPAGFRLFRQAFLLHMQAEERLCAAARRVLDDGQAAALAQAMARLKTHCRRLSGRAAFTEHLFITSCSNA